MAFNVDKCKVMHIGHGNPGQDYTMQNTPLAVTEEERDLGVITSSRLKPGAQCLKAAKTAQAVLGQIARAFHFRDRHAVRHLCQTSFGIRDPSVVPLESGKQGGLGASSEESNQNGVRFERTRI